MDKNRFFISFILRSWWVFLFFFLSLIVFKVATKTKDKEIYQNGLLFLQLKEIKEKTALKNEELVLQINSQKDPYWIEMVLMKELGVVPEGKKKVYFINKE